MWLVAFWLVLGYNISMKLLVHCSREVNARFLYGAESRRREEMPIDSEKSEVCEGCRQELARLREAVRIIGSTGESSERGGTGKPDLSEETGPSGPRPTPDSESSRALKKLRATRKAISILGK